MPCIDFVAEAQQCPVCGDTLHVQKSKRRHIVTLKMSSFEAREVRKQCRSDKSHPVMVSERLSRLVPSGQGYGYDLIVQVGLARYLRNQQREEIRAELLREQGIVISDGTISNLCDRFLIALEALHRKRTPALRAAMVGGYPLHIDATSEHGKGGLFICIDGWRGWVLCAAKISSENEQELRPHVRETLSRFGDPIAVVRDLSTAEAGAVVTLRDRGILDLVCHYHFLGAIGKKLFDDYYTVLRNLLRQSKVRPQLRELLRELRRNHSVETYDGKLGKGRLREDLLALIVWILEGEGRKILPYPFSLPHLEFYQRCNEAIQRAERWLPLPRSQVERRILKQLAGILAGFDALPRLTWAVPKLEKNQQEFGELRDILQLTDAELPRGDKRYLPTKECPELEAIRLRDIEQAEADYREQIEREVTQSHDSSSAKAVILKYLDRYNNHLFGHPARYDEDGMIISVVERTNNVAEHFFGADKQRLRRRLGRANLGRDLEDQPAQAVLTANLRHSDYVRILCGSLEHLPSAIAQLDQQAAHEIPPLKRTNRDGKLLKRIGALLANERAPQNNGRIGGQYASAAYCGN
ncbi:MAG: hypothetical protein ABW166_20230 [Sedimenticola sp.]